MKDKITKVRGISAGSFCQPETQVFLGLILCMIKRHHYYEHHHFFSEFFLGEHPREIPKMCAEPMSARSLLAYVSMILLYLFAFAFAIAGIILLVTGRKNFTLGMIFVMGSVFLAICGGVMCFRVRQYRQDTSHTQVLFPSFIIQN